MEHKKMFFETVEQIKEYFISLIKSGKKVKDDEIIKACQDNDVSDEDMADLIDEILSIDEDIDFDGQANDLEVEMLLEDEVFDEVDDSIIPTTDDDLDDFGKVEYDSGAKINDPVKMY